MRYSIATLLLLVSATASADLTISTGGKNGTYNALYANIEAMCGDKVKLHGVESTGSDQNLDRLMGKESPRADLAFVQTDTKQFTAMSDPAAGDNELKALMVMHPESVHVIAKADTKVGGKLGIGGHTMAEITDLSDQPVGAWGGSYTTARALNAQTNLGMDVKRYDNEAAGMAALAKGEVKAIIYVAGQPSALVQKLNPSYTLLGIPSSVGSKASFYVPARLNYRNLNATAVPSLAVNALLVVRNFKTPAKKAEISALKNCIAANIEDFREGDYRPEWKDIDLKTQTAVSIYETEGAPAAPVTAQPGKKK